MIEKVSTLDVWQGSECANEYGCKIQKQPCRGVLRKRCFENMQEIYRRTPMPECDFSKVALQLYWNCTSVWVFSSKFAAYFQNIFSKNTSGRLLLKILTKWLLMSPGNKEVHFWYVKSWSLVCIFMKTMDLIF